MNNSKRRSLATALISGAALPLWHKPLVNAIVVPAHAQTSTTAVSNIIAASLDGDNPFSRFVLIVDDNDNVLANCGESGGTASAENLPAGTYRVFADSDGAQSHVVDVTAGDTSLRVTVPTSTGDCDFLVATVELPSGTIMPANGEQITSSWRCSTNQGTNCQ
ncbi:hypothetical protein GCM10008090_12710 [Arenicella chitinivorans]|uniref:Carboxypeptidase regulatory-like domain-containing protein n=1 Tax=Arenicella chitinivorans TaxID=1329800 RepID=A0A918RPW3_9GAMM|nr:hypothetical protein [Arenicella chitinivorans]GHA04734.1 hypothetical protein GCM10008090_12710 [Arenicella chitinivorans]